ncbi:MAG TPA: LysR family transcriptional regulator [Chloroflexota bacterium]
MNLHRLQLFRTVVEKGSFSLACRELFISQPALSVQVKRLEDDLGLKLLRRTRSGVAPTPAGQELYGLALGIFEQIALAERRLEALRSGGAGSLAVGTSHTGSLYFLTDAVKAFSQENPAIAFNIMLDTVPQVYQAIQRGTIDVALQWGPGAPAGLVAVELFREPFGVVASPQHPCAAGDAISRETFVEAPLFILGYGVGEPSFIEVRLLQEELQPRHITHLPSIDAVKRLVEANLGLGVLSRTSVERELASGSLTWLALSGFALERPLLLVTNERASSRLVDRFVAFTVQFARARRPLPAGDA